jgi:hypothetical protein
MQPGLSSTRTVMAVMDVFRLVFTFHGALDFQGLCPILQSQLVLRRVRWADAAQADLTR